MIYCGDLSVPKNCESLKFNKILHFVKTPKPRSLNEVLNMLNFENVLK